jgi:hypothetical protein
MAAGLLVPVVLGLLTARGEEPPEPVPLDPPGVRVGATLRTVRATPDAAARRVGQLAPDAPFRVHATAPASNGCEVGWGRVAPDREAWTCLDGTTPTDATPRLLPLRFPFDPPTPDEEPAYLTTGTWPRDPVADGEGLLPFVYLHPRRGWQGPVHPTLDDLVAGTRGAPPDAHHDLAFSAIVEVEGVEIAVAPDGRAARLDSLFAYAASRFHGLDLTSLAVPDGRVPAFPLARAGTPVHAAPDAASAVLATAGRREPLWLDPTAAAPRGWLRVEDPDAAWPAGWIRDRDVRRWIDAPPPDDLGAAWWIDIDLSQQVLAVREGAALRYVTLVSTGKDGHETVTGVFPMIDKAAWWDMRSLPGAADPYVVEAVPWTMHFWPRYALHGAYWHDVFGRVVSHGCINVAPIDAAWIFDRVEPHLHEGWQLAYADAEDSGTVLRVRRGTAAVRDRRVR